MQFLFNSHNEDITRKAPDNPRLFCKEKPGEPGFTSSPISPAPPYAPGTYP